MVYLDGTWKTNVTKGVQLYNAPGLTADTQHIIGTRTVDAIGNVNAGWVNHTARTAPLPDTTAPRSVTGLVNSTYLPTSITWVWTDPTDTDFNRVMVYLDGAWKTNVTKGVQLYSATGLTADTQHTIATKTVDVLGNVNASWVNHTARTATVTGYHTTPECHRADQYYVSSDLDNVGLDGSHGYGFQSGDGVPGRSMED